MRLIAFVLLILSPYAFAANADQGSPPSTGNFSLPTSQQPGPLVSVGENVIDKNVTLFFIFADDYNAEEKHFTDVVPSFLYGITDNLSAFFNVPIAPSYKVNKDRSSGLEDAFLQFEYAFYNNKTSTYADQATVIVNMTVPTGSGKKIPPTGVGALSYFLGATYNRMYVDWFAFTSYGITLPLDHNDTKFGNNYLYELGFGRNIATTDHWIFAWMIEVDGQYTEKNKISGSTDQNSGGNFVFVTPSFWASSKTLILQLGIGLPVTQHLNGNQTDYNFLVVGNVGWTFY